MHRLSLSLSPSRLPSIFCSQCCVLCPFSTRVLSSSGDLVFSSTRLDHRVIPISATVHSTLSTSTSLHPSGHLLVSTSTTNLSHLATSPSRQSSAPNNICTNELLPTYNTKCSSLSINSINRSSHQRHRCFAKLFLVCLMTSFLI